MWIKSPTTIFICSFKQNIYKGFLLRIDPLFVISMRQNKLHVSRGFTCNIIIDSFVEWLDLTNLSLMNKLSNFFHITWKSFLGVIFRTRNIFAVTSLRI